MSTQKTGLVPHVVKRANGFWDVTTSPDGCVGAVYLKYDQRLLWETWTPNTPLGTGVFHTREEAEQAFKFAPPLPVGAVWSGVPLTDRNGSGVVRLDELTSAMELMLRAIRAGVASFYAPTKELRFGGFMYSTFGKPEDWVHLVRHIGSEKIEAAIAKAERAAGGAA